MSEQTKITLYSEASSNHRHYSTCSLAVRLGAITEGLLLLTACGYVHITKGLADFMPLLSFLGLLFTTLLFLMNRAYLKAALAFVETAKKLEEDWEGEAKPYADYVDAREITFEFSFVEFVTVHATFVVLWIAFSFCACARYVGL